MAAVIAAIVIAVLATTAFHVAFGGLTSSSYAPLSEFTVDRARVRSSTIHGGTVELELSLSNALRSSVLNWNLDISQARELAAHLSTASDAADDLRS